MYINCKKKIVLKPSKRRKYIACSNTGRVPMSIMFIYLFIEQFFANMHQLPLCGHCFGPSSLSGARSCPPSPLLLRLLSWPLVKEGVGGSSIRCRGSRRQPGHTWLVWDSFQIIVERLLELINGALCHISQKWGQAVKKLSTVHLKSLLSC